MDFLNSRASLGCPIPCDEHAVSVCLPTHADTVGYEEGHPRVTSMLKIGYPRFKIHSSVELLTDLMLRQYTRDLFSSDVVESDVYAEEEEEEEALEPPPFACYVFPTLPVAKRFQSFMESGPAATSEISIRSARFESVSAVFFPRVLLSKAKAFWQHTGEVVSSRLATDVLLNYPGAGSFKSRIPAVTPLYSVSGRTRHCKSDAYFKGMGAIGTEENERECDLARKQVESRILDVLEEPALPNCIHLVPSGMAAIFSALRLSKALAETDSGGNASARETVVVVFGFPYLDTLKMMQRTEFNAGGVVFLGHGDESDENRLRELLEKQTPHAPRVGAVFTEVPSNPLIKVPDLRFLSALAKTHDFLLVVDDTLGSFAGLDLLRAPDVSVDLLCSSLTKVFSGRGDVLAGSLVINSRARHAGRLRQLAGTLDFAPLYGPDAVALEHNSRDYVSRCRQICRNAAQLVHWLKQQPGVDCIFYPGASAACEIDAQRFDALRRRSSSHEADGLDALARGYLFSIVLSSPTSGKSDARKDIETQIFFDALSCWKGPSLGTNFTLSCLYTLLAHYSELEWAASYGVDKRLVRVSVGLEDPKLLQGVFAKALWACQRPGLWLQLRRVLVLHKGLPLQVLVHILSYCH